VLAQPMVGVLGIGKFGAHGAHVTGDTLQLFALSLVPFSSYLYTLRAFYALHDTRTPFFWNLLENLANLVLALVLFPLFGVQGLAMAWSIAYVFAAAGTLAALRRRIGSFADVTVRGAVSRAAIGSVALAIVAIPLAGAIGAESARHAVVATAVAGVVAGGVYLGVLALLRSEELGSIVTLVRRRGARAADVSP
jgi:putative peptidoglycan lipid II flippase